MHEFSLAQNLTQQLLELAITHQANRVLNARLAIGNEAGVVLDSFRFGFDVLCDEQPLLTGCGLEIEVRQTQPRCPVCGPLDAPTDATGGGRRCCPRCGDQQLSFSGGNELTLLRVELDLPD